MLLRRPGIRRSDRKSSPSGKEFGMSTEVIVLIAVGALVIVAALWVLSGRRTAQKQEDQREIAWEHRQEAERNRISAEERAHSAQLAQLEADAHADRARELDPDTGERDFGERQEVFDGERDGLYTGERPPVEEPEPARRQG
jgi:type II secretory pathway pseudopilin PulG